MALTGRFDFRKTLMGKVILRVEEEVPAFWSRPGERPTKKRWRNATLMDLAAPEMRMLMVLRMKPVVLARSGAGGTAVVVERSQGLQGVPVADPEHLSTAPSQRPH